MYETGFVTRNYNVVECVHEIAIGFVLLDLTFCESRCARRDSVRTLKNRRLSKRLSSGVGKEKTKRENDGKKATERQCIIKLFRGNNDDRGECNFLLETPQPERLSGHDCGRLTTRYSPVRSTFVRNLITCHCCVGAAHKHKNKTKQRQKTRRKKKTKNTSTEPKSLRFLPSSAIIIIIIIIALDVKRQKAKSVANELRNLLVKYYYHFQNDWHRHLYGK